MLRIYPPGETEMPATITHLTVRRHNTRSIPIDDVSQILSLIREEILTARITYHAIASRTGLHSGTISRIGIGHTKQPRASTTITLLKFFGYHIQVRR
jgi:hypothetical protein